MIILVLVRSYRTIPLVLQGHNTATQFNFPLLSIHVLQAFLLKHNNDKELGWLKW